MKNILVFVVGLLALGTFGVSQAATGKNSDVEQKLTGMEKHLYEAWKNHDMEPFKQYLTDDVVIVGQDGIMQARDKVVDAMTKNPCDVKSYSLNDPKVNWINRYTALLTYKIDVDATCGGQKAPSGYASSLWVRKSEKWLTVFHQASPAASPAQ
ncbi:MAG TPA: nuclear transport factor 2 family protein [Terriglobales bacterium]|nr:nuclear transport factor 2 family protein [Terriglobales bacterium]